MIEDLKKKSDDAFASWQETVKQIQAIQPENSKRYDLYKKSLEEYQKALLESKEDDLSLLLDDVPSESTVLYQAREKFGQKIGIGFDGYYPATGQAAPRLTIERKFDDVKLAQIVASMELLLTHLKPIENDECQFQIFDNGLSEHSHHVLMVGKRIHIVDTYSFDYKYDKKSVEEFKSLLDALKWIRKYAWYGD